MRKQSKCTEIIEYMDQERFRKFYGNAIKYVILEKFWDETIPINRGSKFLKDLALSPFLEGFNEQDLETMKSTSLITSCLKEWARFNRGINSKKPRLRLRRRRINQMFGRAKKVLLKIRSDEKKNLRGLKYFSEGIKAEFLLKRIGKKTKRDPFLLSN